MVYIYNESKQSIPWQYASEFLQYNSRYDAFENMKKENLQTAIEATKAKLHNAKGERAGAMPEELIMIDKKIRGLQIELTFNCCNNIIGTPFYRPHTSKYEQSQQ